MTSNATVTTLKSLLGQSVKLQGWVHNLRRSGKLSFIELRDGTGFVQCVIEDANLPANELEELNAVTRESSVEISGIVATHPKHADEYELHAKNFKLIHKSEEFPIGKKEHGPDFLLDQRHLWLRSKKQWAIQRIRNTIIESTYAFLYQEGFIKMDSPIITANACEGTTTLFGLEYFDLGTAYLSQSGQLYLEAGIGAHRRVFDFGPVFRAERSKTRKHLAEFWMMDAEMAFADHQDNMKLQENLVAFMVQQVLSKNGNELKMLERNEEPLRKVVAPFPRITHREAVLKLQELGSEIKEDMDLGAGDETLLAQVYDVPIFIERWPAKIKAFYMKRDPADPSIALAADLMAPEGFGELIGGSQREDSYEMLLERMKEEDMPIEPFQWYLDLRKYGSVPHCGFGFGLERLVAWIAGVEHIRETIPFPRMLYRNKP